MELASDIRRKLNSGEMVFGVFAPFRDANVIEMLARTGFDFLILDAEHGTVSEPVMPALSMACEVHNCLPVVRISSSMVREAGRYLDFGAQAIMAPMVNEKSDAVRLLQTMRYPPSGIRGFAPTRVFNAELSSENAKSFMSRSNDQLISIAQIETKEAVENLSDILTVPDLDMIFIGPADLSVSLGVPMQFDHPDFIGAVIKIAQAAQQHSKWLGAAIARPEDAALMYKLGVRFFAGYFENVTIGMWQQFIGKSKALALDNA